MRPRASGCSRRHHTRPVREKRRRAAARARPPATLGELVTQINLRVQAFRRFHGRPATAAEVDGIARRQLRRGRRTTLLREMTVESGYKGSVSMCLGSEWWIGWNHLGELAQVNREMSPPPPTPPIESAAFRSGHRRFDRAVIMLAVRMHGRTVSGCAGRTHRPRSRAHRTPRRARAPGRAGGSDNAGGEGEPGERSPSPVARQAARLGPRFSARGRRS